MGRGPGGEQEGIEVLGGLGNRRQGEFFLCWALSKVLGRIRHPAGPVRGMSWPHFTGEKREAEQDPTFALLF